MISGETKTVLETLVAEQCINCGCWFGISSGMRRELLQSHKTFYCPNGHSQYFTGKTEAQKLKEELESQKRIADYHRERADKKDFKIRSLKGQQTKLKKRIANGVCPCCKRSFCNLAEHMAKQHPEYTKGD